MTSERKTLNRQILQLAIPSIVSNITVPLLGLVDLAIVGHIGDAAMIGAIAVGGMMFNLIYWVFGFLRMGTSGLTAQAFGAADSEAQRQLLFRSGIIGLTVGTLLIVCQIPLFRVAMIAVGATEEVVEKVNTYYNICIWGAPAVLMSSGLTGWFIGMQNTRVPMTVAIMQNVANIMMSIVMVFAFNMQLRGIAFGTLLAQYVGLAISLWFIPRRYLNMATHQIFSGGGWSRLFKVNGDIFFRTLCLVGVNLYFLSVGARSGNEILAVNTLLMEFYILFSFILDGFAFAGEALGGRYWGERNGGKFLETVRMLFVWGAILTLLFTLIYAIFGENIVSMLTSDKQVTATAAAFIRWTWLIPIAGVAAFVWDGIYIGITATREMLLSAILSAIAFFTFDSLFHSSMGNNALWIAFLLFLSMRGLVQTMLFFLKIKSRQND